MTLNQVPLGTGPARRQALLREMGNQTKRNEAMKKLIPKEKLGKKARKQPICRVD